MKKHTTKALITSLLSMLLCVSMLIGSTFAWFTDTASTGVNTILAGNLDVGLEYSSDLTAWADAENATEVFDKEALWEPGYTEVVYFKVTNKGNLALKYQIGTSIGENKPGKNRDGAEIDLTQHLQFGIVKLEDTAVKYADRAAARAAVTDAYSFTEIAAKEEALLEQNESDIFAMVVWMPETVGNEANHDGYHVPTIKFGVTVLATQKDAEYDSFNNKYDEKAYYSDSTEIEQDTAVTLYADSVSVRIPANTLAAGTIVKLKAKNTAAPDTVVTVDDTAIVSKDISIVGADGNAIAMPKAAYGVTMNIGKDLDASKIKLYHNKAEVTPISYDAATGEVAFTTNSFSPFTAVLKGIGTIDSAEKLIKLRDSINAGDTKAGNTYYLTANIDLAGEWTAINNFAGTFDGQDHIIANMNANLFGTVSGTVKNLIVNNVNITNTAKGGANGFIKTVAAGGLVDSCKVLGVDIKWADGISDMTDGFGGVINAVSAGATVQNCEFADISVTTYAKTKRTGGVFNGISGTVKDCVVSNVNFTVADNYSGDAYTTEYAGGLAAVVSGGAVVEGCTINNMTVFADEAFNFGGLFGKAYVSGQSGDITLKGINVNGLTMTVGNTVVDYGTYRNVGGFIGQVDSRSNAMSLNVDDCHITDLDMTLATISTSESPAAGFISCINGNANIKNCSVAGEIDGTNAAFAIGGFLGDIGGHGCPEDGYTVNISDCKADVSITDNDNIFVGGFVGYAGSYRKTINLTLNFTNCEAKGNFYGQIETGTNETTTFTGCKVDGAAFNG